VVIAGNESGKREPVCRKRRNVVEDANERLQPEAICGLPWPHLNDDSVLFGFAEGHPNTAPDIVCG
jgi:hypothetical protein